MIARRRGTARRLAARVAVEEAAHPTRTTSNQAKIQARLQVLIEARAIWAAIFGGTFGFIFGLVAFFGNRPPLAGEDSIQFYASIVGGITAGVAFLLGFSLNARVANLWLGERPRIRQLMDTISLLVVHSSIAVMASLGIFRVFQSAFIGLTVDFVAGGVLLGVVGGVAAYFSFNSGARINAFSLSTLLGIFMASGILVSMLFAENPFWWHVMFSELGTGHAGLTSFWTFNTTLIISGAIITTLTAFVTKDLSVWAQARRQLRVNRNATHGGGQEHGSKVARRINSVTANFKTAIHRHVNSPRVVVIRILMIGMGVSLAGVGMVPISVHNPTHTIITASFAVFFLLLLTGMPYWLPGFPRAFYVLSYLCAAGLSFAVLLWQPINYYNLTALELIGAGILFYWLIVFIRNIGAQLAQLSRVEAPAQEAGSQVTPTLESDISGDYAETQR